MMIFDLYAVVGNFAVKVEHSLIGLFFWFYYFCVACVCYHCHRKNQSLHSKMGLTSHLSDAYDTFYSSCFSFSSLLSAMTMYLKYFLKDKDMKEVLSAMDIITTSSTQGIIWQNKCHMMFIDKSVLKQDTDKKLMINSITC